MQATCEEDMAGSHVFMISDGLVRRSREGRHVLPHRSGWATWNKTLPQ